MANEFDEIIPNTQTPRKSTLGRPDNQWGEVHASSGHFEGLVLNGQVISGVISYDEAQFKGILDGLSNIFIIIHNLGTRYVDVSVYDIDGNSILPDNVNVIDKVSLQLEFVEVQAGVVLIQKGKE